MDGTTMEMYQETAAFLKDRLPTSLRSPRVAIICGSGLGGLAATVQEEGKAEFDYTSIPHFSRSTGKKAAFINERTFVSDCQHLGIVQGHAGKLVFGFLNGKVPAVLMVGRTQFVKKLSLISYKLTRKLF
jgi:purine-nucleoside phosphorylase